jgi:hypothetical protein
MRVFSVACEEMGLYVLIALFSGLLICSPHAYCAASISPGDSDCGVFGWPVPVPPSGAKLLQVHAIIRHGDRTPWTGAACWPNDSAVWNCRLNSAQIPMYSDTQYGHILPRVYRKGLERDGMIFVRSVEEFTCFLFAVT